jgi:integrase
MKTRKPLSEATVNRDLSVVRHILYWAMDEGYIAHNPFARVRMARERRQRRPVMSVAEEIKLLFSCAVHLVAIIILALDTGMRRGELLHQHWEDVDFDRRLLFVTHSKTPEGEMREIPVTTRSFELLTKLRRPQGLLFTYKGAPLRNLKTGWAAAIRRAGISYYRFHDLRHTFNSRLVEAGVIADVRKELMGHSRGGDVHSIYTHVELPVLRDAIARLEAWHSAKLSSLTTDEEGSSLPQTQPPTE